ncbi:MAG: hypothetical protein J0H49_02670 [Acidobacteria bacterium]|nr:hypothetical protein [Acidobacteriota bacterium]
MSDLPPQSPLSDQLRDRIGARRVRVAVFLTYEFDPAFFETEILQTLFDHDWSRNRNVALAQAEDVLRQVDHLAVYYDQRGIPPAASSASLDYRRFGVDRPGGVFHPKNVLLLLDQDDETQKSLSLLVLTTSANLTRSGWWENLEAAHIIEIPENSKSLLRDDLLGDNGLLSRVIKHDKTSAEHQAIEEIRKFLRYRTETASQRSHNGVLRPRLYVGQKSLPRFVTEDLQIDPQDFNLEIISPYFDNTDEAKAVVSLVDELNPRATRIFLPTTEVGAALCRKPYYEAVASIPRVSWGLLPRNFTSYAKSRDDSPSRFVHAKVYRFFSPKLNQEYLLVGSVNLTLAAHSTANTGNFESAVFFQSAPGRTRLDWWLSQLEDSFQIGAFEEPGSDEPSTLACHNVSFRYDWQTDALSYYWVRGSGDIKQAQIRHRSTSPMFISPIEFDSWVELIPDDPKRFREALRSCSFLEVLAGALPSQRVLVREERMEYKPSLSVTLTPEEILEYWSLFSPEQKSAFLSRKLEALVAQPPNTPELDSNAPKPTELERRSIFDRFAGIFHAFSCLANLVEDAFNAGNDREVRCLLFGSKYDSLKTLIERITAATDADPVNRYITLLCALQVLKGLPEQNAEFASKEAKAIKGLRDLLRESLDSSRGELVPLLNGRGAEFVDWFERMFFLEIPVPEAEEQSA